MHGRPTGGAVAQGPVPSSDAALVRPDDSNRRRRATDVRLLRRRSRTSPSAAASRNLVCPAVRPAAPLAGCGGRPTTAAPAVDGPLGISAPVRPQGHFAVSGPSDGEIGANDRSALHRSTTVRVETSRVCCSTKASRSTAETSRSDRPRRATKRRKLCATSRSRMRVLGATPHVTGGTRDRCGAAASDEAPDAEGTTEATRRLMREVHMPTRGGRDTHLRASTPRQGASCEDRRSAERIESRRPASTAHGYQGHVSDSTGETDVSSAGTRGSSLPSSTRAASSERRRSQDRAHQRSCQPSPVSTSATAGWFYLESVFIPSVVLRRQTGRTPDNH